MQRWDGGQGDLSGEGRHTNDASLASPPGFLAVLAVSKG